MNRAGYGEPDISERAALYALAIARNHPFIDGNKRTAFVALELFLRAEPLPVHRQRRRGGRDDPGDGRR